MKDKTRIKCSCGNGEFHKVTFDKGRVISSGCGDVTDEAGRIATMMRLGAWHGDSYSCAALGALVLHGCEMLLRRPGDEDGCVSLDGWRDIYIRFETLGVVERQMKRTRRRLRREQRKREKALSQLGCSALPQPMTLDEPLITEPHRVKVLTS